MEPAPKTSPDPRARKRRRAVLALLAAPALAHLAGTLICIALFKDARRTDAMDWVVHGFFAAYLLSALAIALLRPRFAPKFALLVYSGVFAVLLAEVVLRVAAPAWPPHDVPWPKMQRVAQAAGTMPGIEGEIRFTTNSIGVRGPEPGDLSQYDHRILCVGGSTTECIYVTDESSWPWALQVELADSTGRSVYVGNAGRSGHHAANHAWMLNHYHYAPRFEWVVIMAGINDMGIQLHDSYEKSLRKVPSKTLVHPSGFAFKSLYYRASEVGIRLSQLRRRLFPPSGSIEQDPGGQWFDRVRTVRRQVIQERGLTTEPPADTALWLDRYEKALMSVIEACRSHDQSLLLITQPSLWRDDLPPELADLLWAATEEKVYSPGVLRQLMDSYNERMKLVAAREGVPCLDVAALIPRDDSAFYDDCHFNIAGSLMVSRAVAAWFKERLKD